MIHIEDDFFKDPYSVRNNALKQEFIVRARFNYPGSRSYNVPSTVCNYILSHLRCILKNDSIQFTDDGPCFHTIGGEFEEGIFHTDDFGYICIIYLSLEPPANSGTELCDDGFDEGNDLTQKLLKIYPPEKRNEVGFGFHKNPSNLKLRRQYRRMRRRVNASFNPIIEVPNRFNRCLVFPATNYHRAQTFFGTTIENSRLTIVCFTNHVDKDLNV
tara:strand:- start:548 stop:1192 length:645 start_codon:yes stop_codon:yes gene_type:complete